MPADVSQFLAALTAQRERVVAAAVGAVNDFGEHVIGDAQQLCPVDTGFLQGSGAAQAATIAGDQISQTIGFNAGYAIFVHENLDAHHDVGQAKFLETAIRENAPKLNEFIGRRVAAAIGGGA